MSLPPVIVERRSDEREVYALINAMRAVTVGAPYWLSTTYPGLSSGVSLGALGAGILQQTVAAGVATPTAFLGSQGSVLFLGAAGALAEDNTGFNYNPTTKRLAVIGSIDGSVSVLVQNGNGGVSAYSELRLHNELSSFGDFAALRFTSATSTSAAGANKLVFIGPEAGNTKAFAWTLASSVVARLQVKGLASVDAADTTLFSVNPPATTTTGWAMVGANVLTGYGMIARTGTAVSTPPFAVSSATYVWSSTGPLYLMTNGDGGTNGTPGLFVQYLASLSAIPSTVQGGSLSTSATDGFLYVSSMSSGAPVGTPTTQTGTVPLVFGGNDFYWYSGGSWLRSTAMSFVANGVVVVGLGAFGPAGAGVTPAEWMAVKNPAGTTRYIPLF